MPATCRCENGHLFHARVIAEEPDENATIVEPDACPECGTEEFTIVEVFGDAEDF